MTKKARSPEVDRLFKHLARVAQASLIYPAGSEQVVRATEVFIDALTAFGKPLRITLMGSMAVAEEQEVEEPSPVEVLFIKTLRKADWESLKIEPGIGAEALYEMAAALAAAKKPPLKGKGYYAGYLTLESASEQGFSITSAAVGYLNLLSGANFSLKAVSEGDEEGLENAREVVAGLALHVSGGLDIFQSVRSMKRYDEYTYTHGLNVSMLVMALGRTMGIARDVLENMAFGALCHDVGKEKIPQDILYKKTALTPDERGILERHPAEGAKLLLKMGDKVPTLAPVIAFEHHMTQDGQGYPARMTGQKPHPATLVVSVADIFDALRTEHPYRPAKSATEAFNLILADTRRGKYHRITVSVLARLTGLTIPGRKLTLTNGRTGEITRENMTAPLAPVVRLDTGEEIDLAVEPGVGIKLFAEAE